ncbi:MAG: nucleotide exchange factor GrpE [Cyanobacteria bacterium P01_H01_bin.74]
MTQSQEIYSEAENDAEAQKINSQKINQSEKNAFAEAVKNEATAVDNNNPDMQAFQSETEAHWENKFLELQDQFTRLAADFENYRKRSRDEQSAAVQRGSENNILALLPVLDNIERATKTLTPTSDPSALFNGFSVIQKQLFQFLETVDVKKINTVGQPFDPKLHDAVSTMPNPDYADGIIAHEAQTGYSLQNKVIRPAQVIVSSGPPESHIANETNTTPEQSEVTAPNPFEQKTV